MFIGTKKLCRVNVDSAKKKRHGKDGCKMRKILLVLVVLMLAAPALAQVLVTCTNSACNEITVSYNADTEPNRVRAFALNITVDSGQKIASVNDTSYHIGESASGAKGYGIFPGSIDINDTTGQVDSNGTPDANGNDYDGTLPGVDTNGVTFEMGSLYVAAANAPDTNGVLFKFMVSGDCTVAIAENTIRGGVVMEDPNEQVDVNLVGCSATQATCECFPSGHVDYADWVEVGRPDCWCYPRQCHGDADNTGDGSGGANEKWVILNDLTILTAGWQKKRTETADKPFSEYICADFDHTHDGGATENVRKWVILNDLTILTSNWQKKQSDAANVDPNCLTWSGFFP